MKPVTYTAAARKTLRRMPANTATRIMAKVDAYAGNPESQVNNVKALKGENSIRLRVGDWRVIMIDGVVIEVTKIAPRGGAYSERTMNDTVTLSRAEYDRMIAAIEDAQDNAAVADQLRVPEEGMPADLVKRMIAGESPVAIHREWRGLSQAALSRDSGVNRVQIVNIEAGRNSGSVETMKKIAIALSVSLDDIV